MQVERKRYVVQGTNWHVYHCLVDYSCQLVIRYLLWLVRVHLFWLQTISGNNFTPHRVFGYAWKIEFSEKAFHLTVK